MDMAQILVDFDVHKLIEQNRSSFDDTPNDVLRRLLNLSPARGPITPDTRVERGFYSRNTFVPAGLSLRKVLRGVTHEAVTVEGGIRYNGKVYDSPSAAACKASGNSVNGWIFWSYFDERTGQWRLLDSMRRRT